MKKMLSKNLLFVVCLGLITGCSSNTKDILGLKRSTPDEFKVISNPPLSVPPEFSLKPPLPEDASLKSANTTNKIKKVLFEKASADIFVPNNKATSNGESAFLNRLGTKNANPQIKAILKSEEQDTQKEKKGLFAKLSSLSSNQENDAPIVNASKEKDRIIKNKQNDKPITEGQTPTVSNKNKGILNNLFGF